MKSAAVGQHKASTSALSSFARGRAEAPSSPLRRFGSARGHAGFSGPRSKRTNVSSRPQATESRIAVSDSTRKLVRNQKRGGETFDSVLRKMADQYDPTSDRRESGLEE